MKRNLDGGGGGWCGETECGLVASIIANLELGLGVDLN